MNNIIRTSGLNRSGEKKKDNLGRKKRKKRKRKKERKRKWNIESLKFNSMIKI